MIFWYPPPCRGRCGCAQCHRHAGRGANHFGLAQLHQLRGRVGRAAAQSYCLLIPDHEDAAENQRLQAMAETNDGFILAERDLQQRGPASSSARARPATQLP